MRITTYTRGKTPVLYATKHRLSAFKAGEFPHRPGQPLDHIHGCHRGIPGQPPVVARIKCLTSRQVKHLWPQRTSCFMGRCIENQLEQLAARLKNSQLTPLRLSLWNGHNLDFGPAPKVTVAIPQKRALRRSEAHQASADADFRDPKVRA